MVDYQENLFEKLSRLAMDSHRKGDTKESIKWWRKSLEESPHHLGAQLNLGALLAQTGELSGALALFDKMVSKVPDHALAHANRAGVLRALGDKEQALAAYDKAINCDPSFLEAKCERSEALLHWGLYEEALQGFNEVLAENYNFYSALKGQGLAALALENHDVALNAFRKTQAARTLIAKNEIKISRLKLRHDREQFRWLEKFSEQVSIFDELENELVWPENENEPIDLPSSWRTKVASFFNLPIQLGKGELVSKPLAQNALKSLNSFDLNNGICVIDELLTEDAFLGLRSYLLESTIWRDFTHIDGFVATYLEDGLASPLLLQIITALRKTSAFSNLPLVQGWAFKGVSNDKRIGVHADDARLSVNFWITPDTANLKPGRGGLIVHRKVPPSSWSIGDYDHDQVPIEEWVAENDTDPIEVPYQANRAVIFDSRLFHGSGEVEFLDDYESRRINLTLLFGFPQ